MKHFLKTLIHSCLLLVFVLLQATTQVHAYNLQSEDGDIIVNISVVDAIFMVNTSTKLTIVITNQYAAEINVIQGSFTLPDGLEFSSDQTISCDSSGSLTVSKGGNQLQITNGTMSNNENCYLEINVKGVQVNNYSISINASDFTAAPFVMNGPAPKNSSGASALLSVSDSNNNTATPTPTATDSATATPVVTNTPIPTDTATTQPTNTPAATSVFTTTPAVTSTPGVITSTKQNQPVAPTQTKKPTAVALVLVITPTITASIVETTPSLTSTTTKPAISGSTPTLTVQTTDSIQNDDSAHGNIPISLIIGGFILLLGAGGFGLYTWLKKK